MTKNNGAIKYDYDYVIVGSGFGGSAAALRLSEKGYKVLVLEKGKWLTEKDFPKRNWNLKRWLWLPALKFHGLFKITFFRHVATLSGVGVGGGSLVYANTLPVPIKKFFEAESWAHLADWQKELKPFYDKALQMMGTQKNPQLQKGDLILQELACGSGKGDLFSASNVAVFFGKPDVQVSDPYFNGAGPDRAGCNFCGGCMLGCRYNAKNTLVKNYLYFALKNGAQIQPESLVYDVLPLKEKDGASGYQVFWKRSTRFLRKKGRINCRGIVFAGGALGTTELLLELKKKSLPDISERIGMDIRTNSESLMGITVTDKETDFSKGVAIGSILHTDDFSHIEPVRYPAGSGFWRILMSPLVHGNNVLIRLFRIFKDFICHPLLNLKTFFVDDWAKRTQILLFMQTINSTLRFSKGLFGMKSALMQGTRPTSFIPEARELADKFAEIVDGKPTALLTETLLGIPTTAHILGGAAMGKDKSEGVIDKDNRVFGYKNMYVCDGAAVSANPGVNPSLTILALSERAVSKIPPKEELN